MSSICIVCHQALYEGADHRDCLFTLFDQNVIKSVAEWEAMCRPKPKTIRKGRIRVLLPKE